MRILHTSMLALAVVMLATPVMAKGDVTLSLKGNRTITGTLDKVDSGKVYLTAKGGAQVSVLLTDLSSSSCATVADFMKSKLGAKDANGFLQLGEFCLRHKLFDRARRAYRKAGTIDSAFVTKQLSNEGIQEADRLEARYLYQRGIDLKEAKKYAEARKMLLQLKARFPSEKHLVKLADTVLKAIPKKTDPKKTDPKKTDPKKTDPKKTTKTDPKKPKKVDPYIKYMKQLMAEIEGHRKQGLKLESNRKHHKAKKEYEKALEKIEKVKKLSDQLALGRNAQRALDAQAVVKDLKKLKIRFHLLLGHLLAGIDMLQEATKNVNTILIDDPEHKEALELRDKITAEKMRRVVNPGSGQKK